jgi:outer membrane lipoprotein LolB
MSLQVESSPPQSLAAVFDLKGGIEAGQLSLGTPLGNILAQLSWSAGSATLRTPRETREYPSVDALLAEVTGTPIPVAALFDWLAGKPATVDGWQADLTQHADGRLRARRSSPAPAADLRLAFERQ